MIGQVVTGEVPVVPSREAAREAARDELSKSIYEEARPPLLTRVFRWLIEQFDRLLERIEGAAPGGWWGLLVLAGAIALAITLVRGQVGPIRRAPTDTEAIFGPVRQSAADYRRDADAARASADWARAVRGRFRAIVRTLEERGLLDERPGRTADEAAADAGRMLPALVDRLRIAAGIFDEVVYGGHPGSSIQDDELRALDEAVQVERPRSGTKPSPMATGRHQ